MTVTPYYPPDNNVLSWLRSFILPTDNVLDVGSGDRRSHDINARSITTLDIWEKAEPDYLLDLEKDDLPKGNFDVILMIDVLEHIEFERSLEILEQAKQLTKRAVVVLTPIIWDENNFAYSDKGGFYEGNEHIKHKSLWIPDDFADGWARIEIPKFYEKYYFGYWLK